MNMSIITNFESVICNYTLENDGSKKVIYNLHQGEKQCAVRVEIPVERKPIQRFVIGESEEYVNGFKIVHFQTGEFGYRRESDGKIMPVYCDIASNFNEYGLALVGRNTYATWIDKNFRYVNQFGIWVDGPLLENSNQNSKGFVIVGRFSTGETPLSLVRLPGGHYSLLNTQGEKQPFRKYDGKIEDSVITDFVYVSDLDGRDIMLAADNMLANGTVLFSRGFYCTLSDLVKLNYENGYLAKIDEQASKLFIIHQVQNNKDGN